MAVVIVGASQGLGEALCEEFYRRGYPRILGASRNSERLQRLKDRLSPQSQTFQTYVCDVRSVESVKGLMKYCADTFGPEITTLIYVAGINFDDVVADWEGTEVFKLVVETNLIGAANVMHAALPLLSASPRPHVVALTSLAGVIGCVPGGSAYAASKAGLDAFFCSCAPELKALGIKVLIVDPGSMVVSDNSQRRQVVGSGVRYRDARASSNRGKPVAEVARKICDAVEHGQCGRLWSTYRIGILGAFFLKLFLPNVLEKLALRVRFKNGGRLPSRLKMHTDDSHILDRDA